jgi:hypothetical protein
MARNNVMKKVFFATLYLALLAGVWLGASSTRLHTWWADVRAPKLPVAENVSQATTNTIVNNRNTNTAVSTNTSSLPTTKNLAIPFTTQAPGANWDADHEEFCEEAAMLMVARYYQGKNFSGTADQEAGLQAVKAWEVQNLGWYFDTTASENAQILREHYGLGVRVIERPTITDIKTAIAAGHPVIIPSAGRELGNPNFTGEGPIYHNLVIRGYTADGKFITNDPGTRKGEQYVYEQSVIMNAIHDWVPAGDRTIAANGSVATGRRVVLEVTPAGS